MVRPDVVLDAGGTDFGSGLLVKLHTAVEALNAEEILEVRGGGPSVPEDLAAWCVLTGNALVGPLQVRKGAVQVEPQPPKLGSRLWLYSNFNCNLACDYCCAESSPRAPARHLPIELAQAAVAEFVTDGGTEVMITGGEPFLHPDLGGLIDAVVEHVPVTVLTNGMVFSRGNRRRTLEALDRERVTLQISLDSATPELHDRHRSAGSFARARTGITLARTLGFRVRIAATIDAADAEEVAALRELLDTEGVPTEDQVIRRIARQGFATSGLVLTRDDLYPEPTLAVDGVWWHPVGITDPELRVTDSPLPIRAAITQIDRILQATAQQRDNTRKAFRCA
ncbi:radical SAM protein [Kibdelosporangium aridum]|uniref:Radical SAM protein n=1 Tax=Kibdelosporangium aridum TaxID=2030 RepID=A0A428ZB17_KIBAR|nr:radical SAM protein [Kibdelosporangium aridum]RSM85221.1 radical SAM protein [Kibdelosporangium aridum]